MTISFLTYVVTFSGQIYFHISYFFTPLQCNYFDTIFTSWSSYFFRAAAFFSWSCFFRTATSSQQFFQYSHFFRTRPLLSSHFLRTGNSVPQLLFQAATFVEEKLFGIEISTEGLLIWSSYFSTGSTFSEELRFEKANFPEKAILPITYFFWRTTFLEWLLTFSKDVTFYSSYLFKRVTFSQHTLSEELLFHGYAFFPQLYFLFIS